jgi:prevent-host-death family protein
MHINILDAKNQLSQLVKRAQAGEEIVIANRGRPVARLVAAQSVLAAGAAASHGLVGWLDAHPLPAHARRSAEEIDKAITQESQAWD